jgi:hypothetical protein
VAELLTNGDMEAWTDTVLATGWTVYGTATASKETGADRYTGSGGAASQKLVVPAPTDGGLVSPGFAVTAGRIYRVTYWGKVSAANGRVQLCSVNDGTASVDLSPGIPVGATSWTQYSRSWTAANTGTAHVYWYGSYPPNTDPAFTFWLDDVSVQEMVSGSGSMPIPAVSMLASGQLGMGGSGSMPIPAVSMAAAGLVGIGGSASMPVPRVGMAATGIVGGTGSALMPLPKVGMAADGFVTPCLALMEDED